MLIEIGCGWNWHIAMHNNRSAQGTMGIDNVCAMRAHAPFAFTHFRETANTLTYIFALHILNWNEMSLFCKCNIIGGLPCHCYILYPLFNSFLLCVRWASAVVNSFHWPFFLFNFCSTGINQNSSNTNKRGVSDDKWNRLFLSPPLSVSLVSFFRACVYETGEAKPMIARLSPVTDERWNDTMLQKLGLRSRRAHQIILSHKHRIYRVHRSDENAQSDQFSQPLFNAQATTST